MPRVTIPKNQHPTNRRKKPVVERNYPRNFLLGPPYPGTLVAIDPGWTTGIAVRVMGQQLMTCVLTQGFSELMDLLRNADAVVAERFTTGGELSAPGLDTIELFAAAKGYCYALGIPFEQAMPAARYTHMVAAKEHEGRGSQFVIQKSKVSKHEIDSLAHLLAYEFRHRKSILDGTFPRRAN